MADRRDGAQPPHACHGQSGLRHIHLHGLHLPSGRKVHVASMPEEQEDMWASLHNGEVDLMLHGSDEVGFAVSRSCSLAR